MSSSSEPPDLRSPDFESRAYWENRFRTSAPYEWLLDSTSLVYLLGELLNHYQKPGHENDPILHIGPGSSKLSLRLRSAVSDPRRITNVDFSVEAIMMGRRWEYEAGLPNLPYVYGHPPPPPTELASSSDAVYGPVSPALSPPAPVMHWVIADLLAPAYYQDVLHQANPGGLFIAVVDKSTTDSLSCGGDRMPDPELAHRIYQTLVGDSTAASELSNMIRPTRDNKMLPVALFAMYLALICIPGGGWMCVSYDKHRFDFLSIGSKHEHAGQWEYVLKKLWCVRSARSWPRSGKKYWVFILERNGAP